MYAITWMNLGNMISEKKPVTKDHILCDSIYMKCLEQANLWRQKIAEQLPGAAGRGNRE